MDEEWRELSGEAGAIWEQNAGFWDDYMGDAGNDFYRQLIQPTVTDLLAVQPGEQVLEIACGNGNFARHLAELGAFVVATDISPTFIERAQGYPAKFADRVMYQVLDATDEAQLMVLGAKQFDTAVCNMGLMDIPTIEPLLLTLTKVLKGNGRFVFSLMHPCFQPPGMSKIVEQVDDAGELVTQYALKLTRYSQPEAHKGLGVRGQPAAQYYFHRPLNNLFRLCFKAGFVIDGLEEPVFDLAAQPNRPFSWTNFTQIPPVLAVRLQLR